MKKDPVVCLDLSAQIEPLLHGQDPAIIGGTLAHIIAMFIAGHRPDAREDVLGMLVECARDLVPACEQDIIRRHGRGDPWKAQES